MKKRLLPIGIQDFASIREDGFVYVDKTARAHGLITGSGKQFFLSRPRRFGKSLLCSTLSAIFEGRRELFQEIAGFGALAVNEAEWGWEAHPVVYIDLGSGDYKSNGIAEVHANLNRCMEFCAKRYGAEFEGVTLSDKLARLILSLRERCGRRAVVIIDEYDKPLLDSIQNPEAHDLIRSALKGFYGVLKPSDKDLRFVFITGVTKFAHVSLFSDLKHYLRVPTDRSGAITFTLPEALEEGNIKEAIDTLCQFLASMPHDIIRESENYYETVIHIIFSCMGVNCRPEVRIAAGRIDALVETTNFVYCFEFKLNKSADAALAQIDTKEYLLPWTGSGKKLFKVGVNFSSETKNIAEWKYETVGT